MTMIISIPTDGNPAELPVGRGLDLSVSWTCTQEKMIRSANAHKKGLLHKEFICL